jgi:S1-C subfamily serine protease/pSer/pThr/pTyr-binding forkhead associated (FHA) protein
MPIELRIESGARAGHVESFDKSIIAIGRHPMMDLRFDPKQDLDVSTRHGEIRFVDDKYSILDSASTNGTFVNGKRVARGSLQELHDKDVIAFGANGPRVTVRLAGKLVTPTHAPRPRETETPAATIPGVSQTGEQWHPPTPPRPQSAPEPAAPVAAPAAARAAASTKPKRSTGERVAVAVAEQTRHVKLIAGAAVIVLGGLAAGFYYRGSRANAQLETLLKQVSEERVAFEQKLGANSQIAEQWRKVSDSLERVARSAKGAQLEAATAQLQQNRNLQRQFMEMDPQTIAANNRKAIVLITSQLGGEKPSEATGFIVSNKGLVVTNWHVVVDEAGNKATRILVRLTGNSGQRRAHVVRVLGAQGDSTDLALIQIEGVGDYPVVRGIANTVDAETGASIVTLGFPLGTDLPMEGSTVEPTLTMGVVGKSLKDLLQIDSWASNGASGSPIFDTHGHVIGVIWGGEKNTQGRVVYAVPANRINELIKNAK